MKKIDAFIKEEPKKKTLRQFKSIDEFFIVTGLKIGDVVQIKNFFSHTYEETSILNGVRVCTDDEFFRMYVMFGSSSHPLIELFKHFKYYKNGKWSRFGVEE